MLQAKLMNESADVVIIGAGFAGAATAYHLTLRGVRKVLLLEREPIPGAHASGKNAALVFQVLESLEEARLAIEGARFFAAPPAEFGEDPLLRPLGSLLVASSGGRRAVDAAASDAARLGVDVSVLSADAVADRVPVLRDAPIEAALLNPSDGVVDIHALLQGYLAGAIGRGARTRFSQPVIEIRRTGGRVEAVVTPDLAIETRCVVNAAGAWAGEIGRLAGVGGRTLVPRRRHLFQTRVAPAIDRNWPFVWHANIDVYFRPEGTGLLMSACDATPHLPSPPEVDVTVENFLQDKLERAFPSLAPARVVTSWACLRTFARDERFVIGRDPDLDGLVWVAGLGGHGMSTSYGVGRLGAAVVVGESLPELEIYSPGRLRG